MIPELSYLGYYGEISETLSMFPAFSQSLDLHSPPAVLNFLYVLSSLEFRGPSYYRLSSTLSSLPPSPSHSGSSAGFHDLIAVDPDLIVSFFL